ncbi:MAG TPA: phage portal protein [Bellilinea sp.]|nr:phage portal protein [Bellilinea sp.]
MTPERSLQSSAVWACVRLLAESAAALPLHLYQRQAGGRRRAEGHPLYGVLHDAANDEMTAYELRRLQMVQLGLRGNSYAYIEWNNRGDITALWPINPASVAILREAGTNRRWYGVELPERFGRQWVVLPDERIWHLRGLGVDGEVGLTPIQVHRNSIGLALATEDYGSRFFSNGAQPGFVLVHPNKLSDSAYTRLKEAWENRHMGLENAHKVAILEEGLKPEKLGVSPEEAQFLETRKFQVSEIARIYHVPPHMVGDLDKATFSNIEHQGIEFVVYSLMPWLINLEQSAGLKLLTPTERKTYFVKHSVEGLLRGDTASRYAAYAVARQWGWMSANDVRELEDMNPVEGGDIYLVPMNMMAADQVLDLPASAIRDNVKLLEAEYRENVSTETLPEAIERRGKASAAGRHKLQGSYMRVIQTTAERVVRRETQDILAQAKKAFGKRSLDDFLNWLSDYYREHQDFVYRQMLPVYLTYAEMIADLANNEIGGDVDKEPVERFTRAYAQSYAERHCAISEEKVRANLARTQAAGSDLYRGLESEVGGWQDAYPETIARRESVRASNAIAVMVYAASAIVSRLVWIAFGESCPYCSNLNGRTVGINENFLQAGEAFKPDGAVTALINQHSVKHAPAHDGCDCMVVSGG